MKKTLTKKLINKIHNIDSRNILTVLQNNLKVRSTVTSPPYFDMKDYGSENQIGFGQNYEEYLNDLQKIFEDIYKITEDDGSLWIVIDSFKRDHQVVTLPFDLANKLRETNWLLQDIIIWKKDKTVPWSKNGFVQRKFEYILFFTKSKNFIYNKDNVRTFDTNQLKKWWVKYPERYNPKGKALDEIWEFPIPVQGSWGDQYIRHFCPLPQEMVSQMIELSTNENDIILDPFAGSGSVMFQSAVMKRNYIGFELNKEFIKMFNNYLEKTFNKARKEYELLDNLNSQNEFESRILDLRILKYAKLLVRDLDKQNIGYFKILTNKKGKGESKNKLIKAEYMLIGEFEDENIHQKISELVIKPPFSKFGIDPQFTFQKSKNFSKNELFGYIKSNSYSYQKDIDLDSATIRIVSNICVDLNENDYL
ncbi:DNA-methyltransferase [Chryseobacterium vrystaatense]|uniref:Methyltransferase n=1 Tax=Chryseobacterium vrystaatense TaxID=307480 RepID=A0A1M5GJI7_9FLAO|nr:site-specific DNA-methyltransferase [Chryseobacterium vrystaatense]SHG03863.1 DNA modification methylase [Chryseobacterium vrystaatense]